MIKNIVFLVVVMLLIIGCSGPGWFPEGRNGAGTGGTVVIVFELPNADDQGYATGPPKRREESDQ